MNILYIFWQKFSKLFSLKFVFNFSYLHYNVISNTMILFALIIFLLQFIHLYIIDFIKYPKLYRYFFTKNVNKIYNKSLLLDTIIHYY